MKNKLLTIFLVMTMGITLIAQEKIIAFKNAKIYSASGPAIPNGVLLLQNRKIMDVGPSDKIEIPLSATIVDLKGKSIMPGLVDTHSHIGIDWGFDKDSPLQPSIRILDAINPLHDTFNRARLFECVSNFSGAM